MVVGGADGDGLKEDAPLIACAGSEACCLCMLCTVEYVYDGVQRQQIQDVLHMLGLSVEQMTLNLCS